ncbi:hypothetical protein [Nibrella viscosa]|uniref:hypothetical protein n=1 Tax=Nibrella viscosa TaxID=1084524 RepID=UPI0031F0FBB4
MILKTFFSRGVLFMVSLLPWMSVQSTSGNREPDTSSYSRQAVSADTTKPQRFTADWPRSHEKALNNLLKGFQRDLTAIIPIVNKTPNNGKVRDFVQVYFLSDTASIANHITPANMMPDKAIAPLAGKAVLKPGEFLRLLAGLYKSDLAYELDRDEMEIASLDSTKQELRQVHRYRLQLPVRVAGRPNRQMQVEVRDTLNVFALVYTDGKQNVRYARIQNIQQFGGSYTPPDPINPPTPPAPPVDPEKPNVPMITWTPAQKTNAVLQTANRLTKQVSDEEFEKIKSEFEGLFNPSGFINLTTVDGKTLELERTEFLIRARQQQVQYDLQQADIVFYDNFQVNALGKPYCRITTYHDVKQYDMRQLPITTTVTTASYIPVKNKPKNAPAGYWLLASVKLKEK